MGANGYDKQMITGGLFGSELHIGPAHARMPPFELREALVRERINFTKKAVRRRGGINRDRGYLFGLADSVAAQYKH
jgi:hypothetical protein